ncbi:MAG: DUF2252 domain-containing protein [Acidobacteriota bacterium]|nr:DUF2252 domain-containing protein [Acidobacteriota bacterium]
MPVRTTAKGVPQAKPVGRELRLQRGRDQRKQLSRKALGQVHVQKRGFDPVELLLASAQGRRAQLLPIKYARMRVSPFAFFRGGAPIMAADLGAHAHSGVMAQLCGDAHVQNMGSFEGPDGRLVFDINDFDETITGPWEWDVKRMAASIALAGFESNHARAACTQAVEVFAFGYCRVIEELAEQPVLVAARHQIRRAKKAQAVSAALKQAERASPLDLFEKYTVSGARGGIRFKKVEHVLWPITGKEKQDVLDAIPVYRESLTPDRRHLFDFFTPRDVAFKIVGTGSVALRDYVVLMDGNGNQDVLFLQIKQEVASAYAPYLEHAVYVHQGQRVAEGQRKIQPLSDPLLGWTRVGEHDYLVRQLNDHKGSINLENLRGDGLDSLAEIAGELLARGHARSGDALEIKGYIGAPEKVVKSLTEYGLEYAAQAQADFEQFLKGIENGRVKVAP